MRGLCLNIYRFRTRIDEEYPRHIIQSFNSALDKTVDTTLDYYEEKTKENRQIIETMYFKYLVDGVPLWQSIANEFIPISVSTAERRLKYIFYPEFERLLNEN